MNSTRSCLCVLVLGTSSLLASRLDAQVAVVYELQSGSRIIDDCFDCDRAPIERPLSGTFILVEQPTLPPAPGYEVLEVQFRDAEGQYVVSGGGNYVRYHGDPAFQSMELEVTINDAGGIRLSSGTVGVQMPWPVIDIRISESSASVPRDPFHVYTLDLIAAPQASLLVPYELVEGSEFVDECPVCGVVPVPIPIRGTFLLGQIGGLPPFEPLFRVDAAVFEGTSSVAARLEISGAGLYLQGGEVALVQSMDLRLAVNGTAGVYMSSGTVPVAVEFPAIDIELRHANPESALHVYRLRIVARPQDDSVPRPVPFRRGDADLNGRFEITDPVSILTRLFVSGGEFPCQDAADANDRGDIDISDALFLLNFLFLGGRPPPAPFPECGEDPTADELTCERYDAC
jgi:hypothetical protein